MNQGTRQGKYQVQVKYLRILVKSRHNKARQMCQISIKEYLYQGTPRQCKAKKYQVSI